MKWNGRPEYEGAEVTVDPITGQAEYEGAEVTVDPITGQEVVVTHGGDVIPVVGELSSQTTPEDFARFRRLAEAFWAKHRAVRAN